MFGDQISSMILVFGIGHFLRRFDLTTPEAIMIIRIMFFGTTILQLLFWYYLRYLVRSSKSEEESKMIEITEPASPFSNQPPKKSRKSVREYDLEAIQKGINGCYTQIVMWGFLHFYFKFTQPLVLQSILPLKNLFTSAVVKIRVFGCAAEGKLARPWKTPSPFGDLMAQAEENGEDKKDEDKATIEATKGDSEESEKESAGVKSRKPRKHE